MRLNSIEIENITSLMGKHYIDCEEILKEGELFAITGPTGSGKSSILTSISLALYGKNHKKSLDSRDFVSLGAAAASIKLNFETKGNKYCASWSLKVLKKNGDPIKKPSVQRVVSKDGIAIESSPEEIIGLTFDQFIRSVILNQGQFSKFLISNFSERRKILERLYSENELSEINKKLRENLSGQKQEIEILKIKLDSSLPYTEDEIVEAEQSLPGLKEDKELKQSNYQDILEIHSQLKDILEFSSKRLQFQTKIKELNLDLTKSNEEVNKSNDVLREKSLNYSNFKVKYSTESDKLKSAISVRNKLETTQEKIEEYKEKTRLTEDKTKGLKSEVAEKDKHLEDLKKSEIVLKKHSSLFHLTSKNIEKLEDLISTLSSIKSDRKIYLEDKSKKELEISEIESRGKSLNSSLEELKENLEKVFKTPDYEEFYINELEEIEATIDNLNKESLLLEQANKREVLLQEELTGIDLKEHQKKVDLSTNKVEKFKSELSRALEKELLQKKNEVMIGLIDDSISMSACNLCKQPIDPDLLEDIKKDLQKTLSENRGIINTSSIQELITEESKVLTILKHEYVSMNKKSIELNLELKELNKQTAQNKGLISKVNAAREKKETLLKKYKTAQNFSYEISITNQKIQSLRDEFKKSKSSISQLETALSNTEEMEREAINKVTGIIEKDFNQSNIDELKRDIKQTNELQKVTSQIENTKVLRDSLTKQLNNLSLDIEELKLNTTKSAFEIKELQNELHQLTGGVNINEALADLEKQREILDTDLKEATKSKNKLETEYARLLTSLDSLKDQISVLENSIISALGNITTINFQTKNLVSSNKETEIFLDKLKSLKTYPEGQETIQGLREGQEKLLSVEIKTYKDVIDELISSISKFEEKISLYRSKEAEQKSDKSLLESLNDSFNRLNNLADVLGKNKDEFRNFVLGFIEHQLIQNTNLELSKICDGRFALSQKESTHGHDFFIVDRWNGAMERKVTTLSGGETFLVSLAMALTLAEMTRGQVDIDCFFIDEGFGSLDADSIEDAFNALMSVRSRGKQIGIISHIRELTSRIPANINLNKSPEGQSKIEYVYN